MRLKSFTANTLPEAMKRVREALGPDAVILSTQPAENGLGVRVTAALEDSPLDELDFGPQPGGPPPIDVISQALSYHRLPPGLFDRLLGAAASLPACEAVMVLAGALDTAFAFAPLPALEAPRPVMLVGAPGAGKTATAAKLCARARLAGRPAALITMDTVKSGGLAQVTAFAKALTARLAQAGDARALAEAVRACPQDHFVVIDTVGANPFEAKDLARVSEAARAAGADVALVLPAGGDAADSAEAALAFAQTGAKGLIGTRLDTARRFGGLLSAAQAGRMALMAAGTSPHIGDPLLPINPVSLARLLLPAEAVAEQAAQVRKSR
ncbi:MAG: GTPase [Kiloniellaceae bacterium]